MARRRPGLLAAALAGLVAAAAAQAPSPAQESEPEQATGEQSGAAEVLPAILDPGAPDGAALTARTVRSFDRYALPVGAYARDRANAREVAGRVIRSTWRLADADATTAAVMAGYAGRLEALGYETIFRCTTDACGGFDFRFAVELVAPPAMLVDAADFAQLSARRPGADGETFLSILVSRLLGAVYIQTVAVGPNGAPVPIAPAPVTPTPGDDATPAAAPAGETGDMIERLLEQGHLPLHGVDFEAASADVTDASAAVLDRAARALAARPGLNVFVVGHSDNRGSLDDNIALSRRRAEAVRAALVERGIPADRLEARGVGFLAPVATNDSERGRALNRRVELVLR